MTRTSTGRRAWLVKGLAAAGAATAVLSFAPAPANASASMALICLYDGSNLRSKPRLDASIVRTCLKNQVLKLTCFTTGDYDGGTNTWFRGNRGQGLGYEYIIAWRVGGTGGLVKC